MNLNEKIERIQYKILKTIKIIFMYLMKKRKIFQLTFN